MGKTPFSLKVGVCPAMDPSAVGDSWSQKGKSCLVPILSFKQPSRLPLRGILPFGEVLDGSCWWRWAVGSHRQLGEPCVNWLMINHNLAEIIHWAPCVRELWVERASRDQLPFPLSRPDLCTLTVPDKCLFNSVQVSQKISMAFLTHICWKLDTSYSSWSLSGSE